MSGGKKWVLAVLLLASGLSTALFFRKDASQVVERQEAQTDFGFRDRVERRVAADAAWAKTLQARRAAAAGTMAVLRVPEAGPAAILDPGPPIGSPTPKFQKSQHPVGSLLPPIGFPERDIATRDSQEPLEDLPPTEHQVADGDTLSKLAQHYLGRADRYLELFEFNRGVLSDPDLLPIGVVLKLPGSAPQTSRPCETTDASVETPPLEFVPRRPEG